MVSMHEESSPSPQLTPTPQCVGREFVRQYYTLLAEAPRYVHRFYSNESIFVHGTDTEEVVGQAAIANKIKDLSFEECRTRIRALDAHETIGKGVVVQVVGEISVSSGPMRRFVQTIVLAPQSERKYYVHNDIFRYEDELFSEKLAQENGAPADPEAETTPCLDESHRRLGSIHNQATMNNGNAHHPDEIENVRYNVSQGPVQHQPIQMPVLSQTQNQQLSSQMSGVGFIAPPPNGPVGVANALQQVADGPAAFVADGGADFVSVRSVTTAAPAVHAPAVIPYGQQPLPQRPQPQPAGQASSAPATTIAAPPPVLQSELSSAAGPATVPEQPARPSSADKSSPSPSEEREEIQEVGSADKTWANVAKQKSIRSPHQVPHQQPTQHVAPAAGTSAPPMLSPTGQQALPHIAHAQTEPANKFPVQQQHQQHQAGRHGHTHRHQRSMNAHPGGGSQDARSSPAPSGHQPNHPGGFNRPGPASVNLSDVLPNDQQVYVKNLPLDTLEDQLKEFFESMGFNGVLETRVRRKTMNNTQFCFAFVTFDSADKAQKLIQKKNFTFQNVEISIDEKRVDSRGGGNAGNYPYNGNRPYPGAGMAAGGRGNANHSRPMVPRTAGAPNRPVPGGVYVGQGGGGGGGGNRQLGGGRTVYSSSTGRGNGGGGNPNPHPQ